MSKSYSTRAPVLPSPVSATVSDTDTNVNNNNDPATAITEATDKDVTPKEEKKEEAPTTVQVIE